MASKEIDAITTQPISEDAKSHPPVPTSIPPKPEGETQQPPASDGQNHQSTDFEYNTQYSLAGGNCLFAIVEFAYICHLAPFRVM